MEKIIFLPGASGNLDFWKPLIEFLPEKYEKQIIGYPGFGTIAEDTSLKNFSDLEEYVTGKINSEIDLKDLVPISELFIHNNQLAFLTVKGICWINMSTKQTKLQPYDFSFLIAPKMTYLTLVE